MKATELMRRLEVIVKEHGDLECVQMSKFETWVVVRPEIETVDKYTHELDSGLTMGQRVIVL